MPTLRNVNPLGEVDVPLLGRTLAANEEFDVSQTVADLLLEQSNYELVVKSDTKSAPAPDAA